MIIPRGDEAIQRRRPDHRHRLAAGRARVERDHRPEREARRRRRHLRRRADRRRRSRACSSSQQIRVRLIEADRERARAVAELLPRRARLPRDRASTRTSSSASGSATRGRRSSRCATTRRTSTPRRSRSCTASSSRSRSSTTQISVEVFERAGDRRRRQPAPGHRRGDRPLRARPADAAGRDARGRPYEVLDVRVREESEYVEPALPRHADRRGALIGAIVRDGDAIFPHGDDVLAPGDRVIVFTESSRVPGSRRRCELTITRAGSGGSRAARRSASTSRAALNLVGALVRYLALAFLLPTPSRSATASRRGRSSRRPVATASRPRWLGARRAGRHGTLRRRPRGLPRRRADVARGRRRRLHAAVPVLAARTSSRRPLDAYFEAMSGFTTTGASVLTDIEALSQLAAHLAPVHASGSAAWGSSCSRSPCSRACASAAGSCSKSEAPGPGDRAADGADPRHRPAARGPLRALTAACRASSRLVGWTRARRRDGPLRGGRRTRSRRSRPAASRPRRRSARLRGRDRSGRSTFFMALAGRELRAPLPSLFVRRRAGLLVRDEEFRLYVVAPRRRARSRSPLVLVGEDVLRGEAAIRHAVFQAVTIMTTTGFASADFNLWPPLAHGDPGRADVHRRLGRLDDAARSRSSATC